VESALWFDALLEAGAKPVQAANWVSSELFGALNRLGRDIADSPVSPPQAAELLGLVADGTISNTIAKQVFEIMLERGDKGEATSAAAIVAEKGLKQTSDTGAIEAVIAKILADNADKVTQFKSGKEALFGFFVGQTMKAMQGKANPQIVNELLKKALG
jgi:aspartyl-tRNA(Asn)/glutamyl-tRNA(Gln) amidotransferase subunit B